MIQQQQDKAAVSNTGLSPDASKADLASSAMPETNRTNFLSRAAGLAALSTALVTNGVPANAQTNTAAEPAPRVAPLVPGVQVIDAAVAQQFISTQVPAPAAPPAAAPAPAVDATKSNITRLEKRPFCMTDEGKILLINSRESQVRRPGSFVEGSPSTGTVLQALAYGKDHLVQLNGGKIPDGMKAKLYIRSAGVSSVCELNLNAIPAVADLGQASHNMALSDPLTGGAIRTIKNAVDVHVKNDGGAFTMTFLSKVAKGTPVAMTVELEK